MDASHPQDEAAAAAGAWVTVEEWSGSSASALSHTAVLTASASSLTSHRQPVGADRRPSSRRLRARGLSWECDAGLCPVPGVGYLAGALNVHPCNVVYSTINVWGELLQTLLDAIGVGEQSATVIGATFQWFLRDLTGMLGGILFTFYQGSNLDSNAKMWRLLADFMNDLGMLMDLLSPLFPSSLIFIMCLGSISRSFTGVASGATRAALTQHFALANDAADISAKEGSQETLATMLGMGLGMMLAHITRGHALSVWTSFLSLTMFHMYANYKAVQSLSLTTLNHERSSILLQYFMERGEALAPQQVSQQEHILPFWSSWRKLIETKLPHERVKLGAKASMLTHTDMLEIAKTASYYTKGVVQLLANVEFYYTKANYFLLDKEDCSCFHPQASKVS